MNCKREIKTLINSFIILIICIFIGSVLVTVANYIPVDEKMKKDIISQLEAEGLFPLALDSSGSESGFHSIVLGIDNPVGNALKSNPYVLALYTALCAGFSGSS